MPLSSTRAVVATLLSCVVDGGELTRRRGATFGCATRRFVSSSSRFRSARLSDGTRGGAAGWGRAANVHAHFLRVDAAMLP